MVAGTVRKPKSDVVLSIYCMTRPHWQLDHHANTGTMLSGFPIMGNI